MCRGLNDWNGIIFFFFKNRVTEKQQIKNLTEVFKCSRGILTLNKDRLTKMEGEIVIDREGHRGFNQSTNKPCVVQAVGPEGDGLWDCIPAGWHENPKRKRKHERQPRGGDHPEKRLKRGSTSKVPPIGSEERKQHMWCQFAGKLPNTAPERMVSVPYTEGWIASWDFSQRLIPLRKFLIDYSVAGSDLKIMIRELVKNLLRCKRAGIHHCGVATDLIMVDPNTGLMHLVASQWMVKSGESLPAWDLFDCGIPMGPEKTPVAHHTTVYQIGALCKDIFENVLGTTLPARVSTFVDQTTNRSPGLRPPLEFLLKGGVWI